MNNIKKSFDKTGFFGPVEFLTSEKNQYYKKQLEKAEIDLNLMQSDYRCKANVLFPWINEISKNPTIIEHVASILGPNFHCWDTLIWIKKKSSGNFVSYHQDATYWNFFPREHGLTVWYTPSGATKEMGCIEYISGSHKTKQQHHNDVKNHNNLLMRGQTINSINEFSKTFIECPPGSFLMHHPHVIHGSGPNTTSFDRQAIGLIFVSTQAKPIETYSPESTVMVSGRDEFNYMIHDPEPTGVWEQDVKNWQLAYDRQHANYYKMQYTL